MEIPNKLARFIELNEKYKIYKGKRSMCLNKVTFYFVNGKQRILTQQDIDCLINIGKKPLWIINN